MGSQVLLSWDTPAGTTDGGGGRPPITARVCLDGSAGQPSAGLPARKSGSGARYQRKSSTAPLPGPPSLPAPDVCDAVERLSVVPGRSHLAVELPPALASGPALLLSYRVELLNDRMHSAGLSAPAFIAAGPSPRPAGPLSIAPRRDGALIRWQPQPSTALMELTRTRSESPPERSPAGIPATRSVGPAAPTHPQSLSGTSLSRTQAREVVLRPESTSQADPGGLLDHTVVDRETYTYIAQRVAFLTLGGRTLEVRGQPSAAATFTYRDVFPPRAPTGLVSIPGGGFGAAPSIDLSWDAAPEPDVLGYNIFRSDNAGPFTPLNPQPTPAPAFRDLRVEPGHTYLYRVTAVDKLGNESPASSEIRETLRK